MPDTTDTREAETAALKALLTEDYQGLCIEWRIRDGFETVSREEGDVRRWFQRITLVTRTPSGDHYEWEYDEALSEYQADESPADLSPDGTPKVRRVCQYMRSTQETVWVDAATYAEMRAIDALQPTATEAPVADTPSYSEPAAQFYPPYVDPGGSLAAMTAYLMSDDQSGSSSTALTFQRLHRALYAYEWTKRTHPGKACGPLGWTQDQPTREAVRAAVLAMEAEDKEDTPMDTTEKDGK